MPESGVRSVGERVSGGKGGGGRDNDNDDDDDDDDTSISFFCILLSHHLCRPQRHCSRVAHPGILTSSHTQDCNNTLLHKERDRQTDRQTDKQTDRHRQTETQTEKLKQRQRDRQRHRQREGQGARADNGAKDTLLHKDRKTETLCCDSRSIRLPKRNTNSKGRMPLRCRHSSDAE